MQKFKTALRSNWSLAFGLLLLTALAYGALIKTLGMYWDDWPSLWFLHFYGPQVFPQAFAIDRPVQGWLFVPTTAIFGESLFAWQVFGILARWVSGLALFWALRLLWPRQLFQTIGVVILFLVYPGFSQQAIAITYGHQFLIYAGFWISVGLMILSIRNPARYLLLTGASLLTGLLGMFALEYFFGLELLRPALLFVLLGASGYQGIRRAVETGKRWLPYLALNLGFLGWRLTHSTPRGEVTIFSRLAADPALTIQELAQEIGVDLYESAVLAWGKAFAFLNFSGIKPNVLLVYLLTALSVAAIAILLMSLARLRDRSGEQAGATRLRWGWSALAIGIYALLVAGWPVWVTNLRLELAVPWDRFTEAMMFGACLGLVGLIDVLFFRFSLPKIALIAALAGVAAGAQFHYMLRFRQEWVDQRNFFWQLAWRAPAIEPGTALLTAGLPFYSSTDNSLSAAVNWIYAPDLASREMPYMIFDVEARLEDSLPSLDENVPIFENYRATDFSGSTSQALVFYYRPPRCLKVLDLYTDRHYPNKPGHVVLAMPLSRLELIQAGEKGDPQMPAFLGPEPMHNWCYFFEKVELAVQLGEWQKAVQLADKALASKPLLTSDNAPELVPFIYAYAHAGKYRKAVEVSLLTKSLSKKMHYYICDTWHYLGQDLQDDPEFAESRAEVEHEFECSEP